MSAPNIDESFVRQFESEVHEAYQREGSKLRNTVRTRNNVGGSSTTFQKIGPFWAGRVGAAFAYHYVLQPLFLFVAALFGKSVALPVFSMESLLIVLLGLLGLGGLRTYEKFHGVTR